MEGQRIVVVGHGPIGHSFIEKLLERKTGCQITVLCEEPRPAYNRVMLTQYFNDLDAEKHDQMKLSYVSEEGLRTAGVELVYGRAVAVDREVPLFWPFGPLAFVTSGIAVGLCVRCLESWSLECLSCLKRTLYHVTLL